MSKSDFKSFAKLDMFTFINTCEFGSTAIIDGETVNVVIDNETLVERQLQQGAEGLHTEGLLFYVEKEALSFFPRPDNIVRIGTDNWKIINVQEDDGMLTVTAEWVSG